MTIDENALIAAHRAVNSSYFSMKNARELIVLYEASKRAKKPVSVDDIVEMLSDCLHMEPYHDIVKAVLDAAGVKYKEGV
jgi:hypothetical protein